MAKKNIETTDFKMEKKQWYTIKFMNFFSDIDIHNNTENEVFVKCEYDDRSGKISINFYDHDPGENEDENFYTED